MTPTAPERSSVFEGTLEFIPLADLIQMLQGGAKTGVLLLRRDGGQTAFVAFRSGAVIQVVSSEGYRSLGDRLVDSGAISRIDLHEALNYLTHFPGMRVGDALVQLERLTRARIEDEVKAQMAETTEQLMSWTGAEFEFRSGFASFPRGLAIDFIHQNGIAPLHLLLEASLLKDKRSRELERVIEGSPRTRTDQEER